MRSRLNILVAAAVMALVIPQFAAADSVEDQLKAMNDRMSQMEDQLQSTQDELDNSQAQVERQESLIEKAGLQRDSKSGLAGFYEQVNISGWLAGSYFYNLNGPQSSTFANQSQAGMGATDDFEHFPTNGGINYTTAPFHPDHNSFSVDQLWFEIEKPVSEESRAGFRADMLYGKTAGILGVGLNRYCGGDSVHVPLINDDEDFNVNTGVGDNDDQPCTGDSASEFNLYQAYVQYLTPFGPTLKAGKMATWAGSEVAGTVYNFNITRGLVYSVMQPINHYGVTLDGETSGGITYGIGAVNSVNGIDPDTNGAKSMVSKIGWSGDTVSAQTTFIIGEENYGNNSGTVGLLDLVVNWNPNENFSGWVNIDYGWKSDGDGFGIATAGRYAFTDRLGFSLRGEYLHDNDLFFGFVDNNNNAVSASLWSLTGTLDYLLADNLTVKAEARYDAFSHVSSETQGLSNRADMFVGSHNNDDDMLDEDAFNRNDQWLMGLEIVYQF